MHNLEKAQTSWSNKIQIQSLDTRLLFSTDELNDFFVSGSSLHNNFDSSKIYLDDELYDDSNFY